MWLIFVCTPHHLPRGRIIQVHFLILPWYWELDDRSPQKRLEAEAWKPHSAHITPSFGHSCASFCVVYVFADIIVPCLFFRCRAAKVGCASTLGHPECLWVSTLILVTNLCRDGMICDTIAAYLCIEFVRSP
jgi:hypothetical protein